jgi:glycosyltransferase involved in cell wall biosynthesis
MNAEDVAFDVVVPTIGRSSLTTLLRALDREGGRLPDRLILVDDRTDRAAPLPLPPLSAGLRSRLRVVASNGRGPAAARNAGWRSGAAPWVAFVDDDVVPVEGWLTALARDLRGAGVDVGGSQGSLTVPLSAGRAPTDWERNVASLETGDWITADMAYRRAALEEVGGFDGRFRRAYREDTDLALRVLDGGWRLVRGRRAVRHPVGPGDGLVSLRLQRGNADDVLLTALHPGHRDGPTTLGKRPWHAATVAAFVVGVAALAAGARLAALASLGCWVALTAALAWRRIAPGPRTAHEVATMLATSVAMPFVACAWWLVGVVRLPRLLADERRAPHPAPASEAPASTLEAAS